MRYSPIAIIRRRMRDYGPSCEAERVAAEEARNQRRWDAYLARAGAPQSEPSSLKGLTPAQVQKLGTLRRLETALREAEAAARRVA